MPKPSKLNATGKTVIQVQLKFDQSFNNHLNSLAAVEQEGRVSGKIPTYICNLLDRMALNAPLRDYIYQERPWPTVFVPSKTGPATYIYITSPSIVEALYTLQRESGRSMRQIINTLVHLGTRDVLSKTTDFSKLKVPFELNFLKVK